MPSKWMLSVKSLFSFGESYKIDVKFRAIQELGLCARWGREGAVLSFLGEDSQREVNLTV